MKNHHPLTLDLNNACQPALENGIKDFETLNTHFQNAHPGVMALKKTGHLPFHQVISDDILIQQIERSAAQYDDLDNVIVFGIGGSALGAIAIDYALKRIRTSQTTQLFVFDHIEAEPILAKLEDTKDQKNLYVFISKSGNTSETLAQFRLVQEFGIELTHDNSFFITDPHNGYLHDHIVNTDWPSLPVPSGVGGRFSVFTPVGLFPLACAGYDFKEILDGARHAEELCQKDELAQNPAGLLATSLFDWIQNKPISQVALMPYSDRLRFVSDWFAQLWSESLGKKFTNDGKEAFVGTTALKTVGVTDQHSQLQLYLEGPKDKVICFLELQEDTVQGSLGNKEFDDERVDFLKGKKLFDLQAAEKQATEESLRLAGRPNLSIKMTELNSFQMGQLLQTLLNVIPYMGALMNINAFDQPAVEQIKQFTFGLMGRPGFEEWRFKMENKPHKKEWIF